MTVLVVCNVENERGRPMRACGNRALTIVLFIGGWMVFADDAAKTIHAHEQSADEQQVTKVSDEVAHRPTAIPDRILLTWTSDPSVSQTVTWRTDNSVANAYAEYAVAGDGPRFPASAAKTKAKTTDLKTDLGEAHYHEARFLNLRPRTKYAYRVGDGTNWSEWNHFTTASNRSEAFQFVYFGDAQNELKSHWSRVIRQAYRDAPKASFLLHAGDLVNGANSDADWGEWFYAGGFIHRTVPCIATPGNHEYYKVEKDEKKDEKENKDGDEEEVRLLSCHWQPTFAFPSNGPAELQDTVFWIDFQGTRIISLNSNEQQQRQVEWLQSVLNDNPNNWTIITFHHPIYSTKVGRDNPELRSLWQPVFDKHRVDLVLQGHDHTYGRTKLMTFGENVPQGITKRSKAGGTMYVVSVSGPKMYELGRRSFMRRAAEETQLYQIIAVDGDELRYEARTAIGRLYDAFTLRKRPGKPNKLIEQVPDTTERRRLDPLPQPK